MLRLSKKAFVRGILPLTSDQPVRPVGSGGRASESGRWKTSLRRRTKNQSPGRDCSVEGSVVR